MSVDYNIRDHKAWLGYIQPDGLVVSPAALVDAQVLLDRNTLPLQERFLPFVSEIDRDGHNPVMAIADFPKFVRKFLEWPDDCMYGLDSSRPLPESLFVSLSNFGETLSPSFAFRDPRPKDAAKPWILLVQTLPLGTDLDARQSRNDSDWNVSPSQRFERLLRQTNVPIGLLSNGEQVRLIYAPHGENSGSATFAVKDMTEVAGRPILAAFHMLLDRYRLLAAPSDARLPALLARSRDYQSRVSTTLAQQVLDALYEMLRGFQGANERVKGELLRSVIEGRPDDIYGGLLTVLMRLVFLLFAEDRGLMPTSELYVRHYSIHGLFERLRTDNEQYPDTMDHRFGAWAQLLTLFRVVYQGCKHLQMQMPARHGHLFDPARFSFLEGQTLAEARLPLVSDGTVFRVLEKLFILDGERLSYRTLDVEEIGSVYQTVMGFRLEVATAPSIAIAGKRKHKGEVAAPTVINLDELLGISGNKRKEWLKECTDQELSGEAERALKSAATLDDLMVALDRKIARNATPQVVPTGAAVLQPTDERRRSGSHYTPRSFTEPIVRTTLRPILQGLGEHPTPEQILDLKVCDLAVGSAAFLVESCRQLGDALVNAWQQYGNRPPLPPDETEELLARRLVAQRCLYGVDRNPMAVDLAKLSLWLATLAKDHPFTFLDHSLRCGDALVGLTRQQIADFHWLPVNERVLGQDVLEQRIRSASKYRKQILDAGDLISPLLKHEKLGLADEALNLVREAGDLVIAAFFSADKDRVRRQKRDELLARFTESFRDFTVSLDEEVQSLRRGRFPVTPFHWEIEFPEVFDHENPGFDAIVGNPPFAGKNTLINGNRDGYLDWLKSLHQESHGNADLVAHFFRRAFNLLRRDGCFGLIATNTIGQGDTRSTGLRWICTGGGTIYAARRRAKWPGQAAVIVSVVNVTKGKPPGPFNLEGRNVPIITAYLFHAGGHDDPAALVANEGKSFQGSIILGMGFTFDDLSTDGVANSISEMDRLIAKDPHNAERIFPYIGGEEVNESPTHEHRRYVINFADYPQRRAEVGITWAKASEREREEMLRHGIVPPDYPEPVAADWPDLLKIVEEKVKPERLRQKDIQGQQRWWNFLRTRGEMQQAIAKLDRVLARSRIGNAFAFTFLPSRTVANEKIVVFPFQHWAPFVVIQSRIHEVWAVFFSSTLKDDLQYTPSDCFETFPFPHEFESNATLEQIGREYYEFRAAIMVRNNEGLTKTYNRFHNPDERQPDILRLRELHAAMDRAVLEAYGWNDLAAQATCKFLLDYEDEEDESERPRRRKKPWRYRWPDEIRDEVLARLLTLNAERAKEEQLAGEAAAAQEAKTGARKGRKKSSTTSAPKNQIGLEFKES
jgi:Eco57I restriction-modification methylase/restriction-modification enzyme MmeI-like protein